MFNLIYYHILYIMNKINKNNFNKKYNKKSNRKSNRKSNKKYNKKSNNKSNKRSNNKSNRKSNIKNRKNISNSPILKLDDLIPTGAGLFSSDDTKKILKKVYQRIKKFTDNPDSGLSKSSNPAIKSIFEGGKLKQINDTKFFEKHIEEIGKNKGIFDSKNTSRYLENNNLDFYNYLVDGKNNKELITNHEYYKEGLVKLNEKKDKSKTTNKDINIDFGFTISYNNDKDLYQILAKAVDNHDYYKNIMTNEDKVVLYSLLANIFYKKLLENIQKIRIESKGYIEIAKTLGTGLGEGTTDVKKRVSEIKEAESLDATSMPLSTYPTYSVPSMTLGGEYNKEDIEKYYKIVVNNVLDQVKEPILLYKHSDLSDTYVEKKGLAHKLGKKCIAASNYCTSGLIYRKINDPFYNSTQKSTDMSNIELDNKIFHSLREARKYLNLSIIESKMAYLFRYGSKNASEKNSLLKTNNIYEILEDNASILKTLKETIIDGYIKNQISPSKTSISSIISSTEPLVSGAPYHTSFSDFSSSSSYPSYSSSSSYNPIGSYGYPSDPYYNPSGSSWS